MESKRVLKIKNFRNIGFEKEDTLVLNNTLDKKYMGNLIVLIGPNNSGKSNVLSALKALQAQSILPSDITRLFSENDYEKDPEISLECNIDNNDYVYKLGFDTTLLSSPSGIIETEPNISEEDLNEIMNCLNTLSDRCSHNSYYDAECDKISKAIYNLTKDNNCSLRTKLTKIQEIVSILESTNNSSSYLRQIKRDFRNTKLLNFNYTEALKENKFETINSEFKEKYGTNFIPSIIEYKNENISSNNLHIKPNDIEQSTFFKTLLKLINLKADKIKDTYKKFNQTPSKGILENLESSINRKLTVISKKFNDLYFAEQDPYTFKISLETENIWFIIKKGTQDANLDSQSTGFKWFFNLYFNLMSNTTMECGDILIMDEPATNLHPAGQTELRRFLKDFSKKNGITIILATHSPFMADPDYFDEIRTVSSSNGIATLHNDFSSYNTNDPDTLTPIKESFTIGSNILYDRKAKIVFVEGITDYNYLTTFKRLLNIDNNNYNIHFLPIQGIGNMRTSEFKEKQKNIIKKLIKLWPYDPVLLVDSDGPGMSIKNEAKNTGLKVFTLKEANPAFTEIESLFDKSDLEKLKISKKNGEYNKHAGQSALIKTYCEKCKFSQNTLKNFKSLFDLLLD